MKLYTISFFRNMEKNTALQRHVYQHYQNRIDDRINRIQNVNRIETKRKNEKKIDRLKNT